MSIGQQQKGPYTPYFLCTEKEYISKPTKYNNKVIHGEENDEADKTKLTDTKLMTVPPSILTGTKLMTVFYGKFTEKIPFPKLLLLLCKR